MSDSQNASFSFAGVDASNFTVNQLLDVFGIVKEKLQQAANNPSIFAEVFGVNKASTREFQSVIGQWKIGDFSQLPSVQVISAADMNGADGAYASSTQKIYFSDSLFQSNAAPVNSVLGAAGVLTEETFHWLDDHVGTDTQGDEGELARGLLFDVSLSDSELARIKNEDDRGFINVLGQSLLVEEASTSGNNANNTPIFPKPDLIITNQTATSTVTFGGTVKISATVKNIANRDYSTFWQGTYASSSNIKFWLSNDTNLDSSDIAIGTSSSTYGYGVNFLAPGASQSVNDIFDYNNKTWGTGTKYILFQADAYNSVSESNESNNVAYATIFVKAVPDLTIAKISGDRTLTVGSTVSVGSTVINDGNATAGASTTKYWLSNDQNFDSSDILLGSQSINSLSAGASLKSNTLKFTYDKSWGTGTKYIIAQADSGSVVTEKYENNNIAYASVIVNPGNTSDKGLKFVAVHEGTSLKLYNDSAGHATIGIGHLVHLGPINGKESLEFKNGISQQRALELLKSDLAKAENAVKSLVKVALTQYQFDALVSFTFNLGSNALKTSSLLTRLNKGEYSAVPYELSRWVTAGGVKLPGLVKRRTNEGKLFSQGIYS